MPVDHDDLLAAVLRDEPGPDDRLKHNRRLADLLLTEVYLQLRRPKTGSDYGENQKRFLHD